MSVTEIAKRAGVSIATVSRVLNGNPRVRPETAQQVRRVLDDVGYARPMVRRGPRLGRRARAQMARIAVVSAGYPAETAFRLPVFASVLSSVVQAARSIMANVLVDHVPSVSQLSASIRNAQVDGALVLLPAALQTPQPLLEAIRRHVPIVRIMGEQIAPATVDHVTPDHAAVGHMAGTHLTEQGCQELAFVTLNPEWELQHVRAFGFLAAAARARVNATCYVVSRRPLDAECFGPSVIRCESEIELADRLTSAAPRLDGLFIARDGDTARLYPMLQQRDIHPGRDVTVISCDNDESKLSMLNPRPVSIDLNPEEIGRCALLRLGGRIQRPDEPAYRILVAPRLLAWRDEQRVEHIALD